MYRELATRFFRLFRNQFRSTGETLKKFHLYMQGDWRARLKSTLSVDWDRFNNEYMQAKRRRSRSKSTFKPFPKQTILDSPDLKEFADDNFKFVKNGRKLSEKVENTI